FALSELHRAKCGRSVPVSVFGRKLLIPCPIPARFARHFRERYVNRRIQSSHFGLLPVTPEADKRIFFLSANFEHNVNLTPRFPAKTNPGIRLQYDYLAIARNLPFFPEIGS